MSEPGIDPPPGGRLLEEAAGWFARMRGPDAEQSRGQFEAWLAQGSLHREAYNRAAEIFAMGKLLADDDPAESNPRPTPGLRHRSAFALAALAALAAGATWTAFQAPLSGPRAERHAADGNGATGGATLVLATAAGESRTARLGDGSRVRLGGATILAVRFGATVRELALQRGLARFEVAHGPRPFVVLAGGGLVTARGTLFDVAIGDAGKVSVRLVRGVVDVALPASGDSRARSGPCRLKPGQSISFAAAAQNGSEAKAGAASTAASLPEEFDEIRLAELVAMANRGSPRPILLAGELSARRVSGRFRIGDTELLANRIAALFDLAIDRRDMKVIVLRPR